MTDRDDRLPQELGRRNLKIWGGLTLLSLAWQSSQITLGVFLGGLVAVLGYYWLQRSITGLLAYPDPGAPRRYQFSYFVRLSTLAAVLFLLIAVVKIDPLALSIGLSVVVLNLIWTTMTRVFPRGGDKTP